MNSNYYNFTNKIETLINPQQFSENCRFNEKPDVNSKTELRFLKQGTKVSYNGKDRMGHDNSRYQTNIPFPIVPNSIFYFEIFISEKIQPKQITIGLAPKNFPFNQYPGFSKRCKLSIGYNFEGIISFQKIKQFQHKPLKQKDNLGIGINWITNQIFFTLNGQLIGVGQEEFDIEFNFGKQDFVFDIKEYSNKQIQNFNEQMQSKIDYFQLNEQVLNYLIQNGYKESFQAFQQATGYDKSLKTLMNHKDNINQNNKRKNSRRKSSFAMDFELSSRRSIRKDSEVGSRRQSLVKSEIMQQNEDEEIMKLLKLRSEIKFFIDNGQISQAEDFLIKNFSYSAQKKPKIDHQLFFQQFLEKLTINDKEAFDLIKNRNLEDVYPYVYCEKTQKIEKKSFLEIFPDILIHQNLFEYNQEQRKICFQVQIVLI